MHTRINHGMLNIEQLYKDGFIKPTKCDLTSIFLPCKLFGIDGAFIGQHSESLPSGLVLFISQHTIFEGHISETQSASGFGRKIVMDTTSIGWYKESMLQGNCSILEN